MRLILPKAGKGPCWSIRVVKREPLVDGEPVFGYCDYSERELVISEDTRRLGIAREILLHEALHKACPFFAEEAVEHLARELAELLDMAEAADILD